MRLLAAIGFAHGGSVTVQSRRCMLVAWRRLWRIAPPIGSIRQSEIWSTRLTPVAQDAMSGPVSRRIRRGRRPSRPFILDGGQEARGYVAARLLRELPAPSAAPSALLDRARVLDTFYIPTRYPNSHAEGPPFEHYGSLQSEEALRYAGEIVEFVRAQMAGRTDR